MRKTSIPGSPSLTRPVLTSIAASRSPFARLTAITLTTGTAFIMWLGEQVTERGIGNGISLIIFAGIVAGLPQGIVGLFQHIRNQTISVITLVAVLAFMVIVCMVVVFVERGQRRFPGQYAKPVVGRRVYGGQSTHLPLKVNTGGVIPVIFASSLILLLAFMVVVIACIVFFERSQRRIPIQYARRVVGRREMAGGMSYFPLRLHMPQFLMLIIAGTVHVFPVHIY